MARLRNKFPPCACPRRSVYKAELTVCRIRFRQTAVPTSLRSSLVAKGRPIRPQVLLRRSDIFRLDAHAVIYCNAQFLFAAQVTLCCLDRDVSEQELNLIEFAAGEVTEPGATAPQV